MTNESLAAPSCCSTRTPAPAVTANGRDNLLAPAAQETAVCPVMGGTAVTAQAEAAGLFRDYEGSRYWFCCASCGPVFDSDPAKYAGRSA
ncbi:hypothetical protein CYJ40_07420 [Brevibacterium ravenspurgense]|uniref:Uncharacterized protein n=1 Tax=Brevibacterium ravenspurgense TaxID=479117 RepID=A0A2I1IFI6_9MICO|nr:YHS domain-containing protein [Brevibacterium ravenspurgense]PKY69896.1 hypothetical protein CYJ40_07420 [Brevibacterium ravenspurgense]